jgi:tetratricopeptide (TPR) repeat protein
MLAFFLATAAIGLTTNIPTTGSVITLGSSFARSCYLAAEARSATSQAVSECDRAFQVQPLSLDDRVATHVNRGILHMLRRDFGAARADLQAAITLKPREPESWLNLGVLLYNEGDSAGAVPLLDRALELRTRAPALAYFARGLAHEETGNVRAAYDDLRRAQSLRPSWSEPARELARYQVRRN